MMDLIRKVQEQDWTAIEDLVKQAFATASYSDGTGSCACGPGCGRGLPFSRLSPYG